MAMNEFLYKLTDDINDAGWLRFARTGLKLDEHHIDNIQTDHRHSVEEKKIQMLKLWIKKNPGSEDEQKKQLNVLRDRFIHYGQTQEKRGIIILSHKIKYFCKLKLSKFGKVYQGEMSNPVTGTRPIAVKILGFNDTNANEVKILSKLNPHPNVVAILETDAFDRIGERMIYIAMELCNTQNLYDFVMERKRQKIPHQSEFGFNTVKQLLAGMRHIHGHKIIHRDLKPHNILSTPGGVIKIADYGLSKQMTSGRSVTALTSHRVGTDGYRAPETYNSNEISLSADIFSLALTFHFVWSNGLHPFGDDPDDWNSNIKKNRHRNLSQLIMSSDRKTLSCDLLGSMLSFNPKDRPTIEEVAVHILFDSVVECMQDNSTGQAPFSGATAATALDTIKGNSAPVKAKNRIQIKAQHDTNEAGPSAPVNFYHTDNTGSSQGPDPPAQHQQSTFIHPEPSGPEGEALPIYIEKEDGNHKLLKNNLKKILLQDGVRDVPLMVLSVAGAPREGKSFILNFFIKYLKSGRAETWLQDKLSDLEGFSWRGGLKPDTMGILMWSKAFHIPTRNGKVAILLMDTQGTFDNEQSMGQSSRILTMSILLSSVQVYNVMRDLRIDELFRNYFEVFTEHAKSAKEVTGLSLSQSLLFLIRDWFDEASFDYGLNGGTQYVMEQLSSHTRREALEAVFTKIQGFLMPEPGKKVSKMKGGHETFTGALRDIDPDFVKILPELKNTFFEEDNIVVKKFAEQVVHGEDMMTFVITFAKTLKRDDLPEAKNILEATIFAHNDNLIKKFSNKFKEHLEQIVGERPFASDDELNNQGNVDIVRVISDFMECPYIGGKDRKAQTLESMKSKLHNVFESFKDANKLKKSELQQKYDEFLVEEVSEVAKKLQRQFHEKCVEDFQINEACKTYTKGVMKKLTEKNLGWKAFDEKFAEKLQEEMERLRRSALMENKRMENHIRKVCTEMTSKAIETARQLLLMELKERVCSSESEIDEIMKKITEKKAIREWSDGLDMTGAISEEYDNRLREKLLELRTMIVSKSSENKGRFENEAFLAREKLLQNYEEDMKEKMGTRSWKQEDMDKFDKQSCQRTKKMLDNMDLVTFVREKCLESLDSQLKKRYDNLVQTNVNTKSDFDRQCKLQVYKCHAMASNNIKRECGKEASENGKVRQIYMKWRDEALKQFKDAKLQGPEEILDEYYKQLETDIEKLLDEALTLNKKNEEAMKHKVWDVITSAKYAYRAEMEKTLKQEEALSEEELSKKHSECKSKVTTALLDRENLTSAVQDHCLSKLEEVLSNAFLKYRKENYAKKAAGEQKIKEVLRECMMEYNKLMEEVIEEKLVDQDALSFQHDIFRKRTLETFEGKSNDLPTSTKEEARCHLEKEIDEALKRFRKNADDRKEWAKNESFSHVTRSLAMYKQYMDSEIQRKAGPEDDLLTFHDKAVLSTKELLMKMNIKPALLDICERDLKVGLEEERVKYVKQNKGENDKLEKDCKTAAEAAIKAYQDVAKKADAYLDDASLERLHANAKKNAERAFKQLSLKGNKKTIDKYERILDKGIDDRQGDLQTSNSDMLKKLEGEATNKLAEAINRYKTKMKEFIGDSIQDQQTMQSHSTTFSDEAKSVIRNHNFPGQVQENALSQLQSQINAEFSELNKANENKKEEKERAVSNHADKSFRIYEENMKTCNDKCLSGRGLTSHHDSCLEIAVTEFNEKKFSPTIAQKYPTKLKSDCKEAQIKYETRNETNWAKVRQQWQKELQDAKSTYLGLMRKVTGGDVFEGDLRSYFHNQIVAEVRSNIRNRALAESMNWSGFDEAMQGAFSEAHRKNESLRKYADVELSDAKRQAIQVYRTEMDAAIRRGITDHSELIKAHYSSKQGAQNSTEGLEVASETSEMFKRFQQQRDSEIDVIYNEYKNKLQANLDQLRRKFETIVERCSNAYRDGIREVVRRKRDTFYVSDNRHIAIGKKHSILESKYQNEANTSMTALRKESWKSGYLEQLRKNISSIYQDETRGVKGGLFW